MGTSTIDWKKALALTATIVVGNLIYALGIVLFVLPGGLVTGGTTGIALAVNHACGFSITAFVAIFNIAMFFLGLAVLGWRFAATTLASTIVYPLLLGLLQQLLADVVLTEDRMLCALFGGLLIGVGLAAVLRMGASTGGMDIPPLALNKIFGLPVSACMYAFDFCILLLQAMFSDLQGVLYGIVLILTYTITLDKLLAMGEQHVWLDITSAKAPEIQTALENKFAPDMLSMYNHRNFEGLETVGCVVTTRQAHRAEMTVLDIDPDAVIVESRATRVRRLPGARS